MKTLLTLALLLSTPAFAEYRLPTTEMATATQGEAAQNLTNEVLSLVNAPTSFRQKIEALLATRAARENETFRYLQNVRDYLGSETFRSMSASAQSEVNSQALMLLEMVALR